MWMKSLCLPTVEAIDQKQYADLSPNTLFRRIVDGNLGKVFCAKGKVDGQSGLRAFRVYHNGTIAPTSNQKDVPHLNEVVEILPVHALLDI
jgi:hypothetical protein